jgi:hypothetical protein
MKHAFNFQTYRINVARADVWLSDLTEDGIELYAGYVSQRIRMFDHCLVAAFQIEEN